jgi:hypothetical protein
VAFDAGNLLSVAQALHTKFPKLDLVLCADDDYRTEGNPGITKATEAAQSVGGRVVIPVFSGNRAMGATDFNDLSTAEGLGAVRLCIEKQLLNKPEENQNTEWMHPTLPLPMETDRKCPWIVGDVARMLREEPPPVRWLVEGLIPASSPGLFAARAGAGKSMTSLLIALGLASGHGVLGIGP